MSVNSMRDFYKLSGLPVDMRPHVWALREKGVDFDKLLKLVAPPKRGRPRKAAPPKVESKVPFTHMFPESRWNELVRAYRDHGLATSEKQAIRQFVRDYVRDVHGGNKRAFFAGEPRRGNKAMTEDALVASLQQRLSRWRRTLRK